MPLNLTLEYERQARVIDEQAAEIARLTAFNESMQTDGRKNTETIAAQKELLIKAESALTYANWDGEFSNQATTQYVINARDAIRAHLEGFAVMAILNKLEGKS